MKSLNLCLFFCLYVIWHTMSSSHLAGHEKVEDKWCVCVLSVLGKLSSCLTLPPPPRRVCGNCAQLPQHHQLDPTRTGNGESQTCSKESKTYPGQRGSREEAWRSSTTSFLIHLMSVLHSVSCMHLIYSTCLIGRETNVNVKAIPHLFHICLFMSFIYFCIVLTDGWLYWQTPVSQRQD